MTRRDIPNAITLGRILLVWPLVVALLNSRFDVALVLFTAAGLSDGIDGFLARHNGWSTRLGALLDPLADKLLLVSAYLALGWNGLLPVWLVAAVLARDVIIVGGAAVYRLLFRRLEIEPTAISKLNTVLQIVLVLTVMLTELSLTPPWISDALLYVVFASTVLSGLNYVLIWGRKARQEYLRAEE